MTLEKAKKILSNNSYDCRDAVRLYCLGGNYVNWSQGNAEITIEGEFEIDVLEAIVVYIRAAALKVKKK